MEGGSAVPLFPLEKFRAPPPGFQTLVHRPFSFPATTHFKVLPSLRGWSEQAQFSIPKEE